MLEVGGSLEEIVIWVFFSDRLSSPHITPAQPQDGCETGAETGGSSYHPISIPSYGAGFGQVASTLLLGTGGLHLHPAAQIHEKSRQWRWEVEVGLNRAKGCPLGYCPGIKRGTKVVLQELDMHIAQTLALTSPTSFSSIFVIQSS